MIPKTIYIKAGQPCDLLKILQANGIEEAVVKPAVSMLGLDTWRTSQKTSEKDQPLLGRLLLTKDVLIQEFIPNILTEGEISLIFIDGEFSHAVRKVPREGEFRIHEEHGGNRFAFSPTTAIIHSARRVLDCVGLPLLYARVDGVQNGDQLALMEVELIDPSLFLKYDSTAPARFAHAIAKRLEVKKNSV